MVHLNWDYAALSRVGQAHWLQQLLAPIKVVRGGQRLQRVQRLQPGGDYRDSRRDVHPG